MQTMKNRYLFFLLIPFVANAQRPVPPAPLPDPAATLQMYHASLTKLRQAHTNQRELPDLSFFLFGMGDRLKLIYRDGRLLNALTGNIEEQWTVKRAIIIPSEYTVHLDLAGVPPDQPQSVQLREDQNGVWILQPGKRPKLIPGTRSPVSLPQFADHPYGPILRVLHQEILVNISNGRPLPNFMAYSKPWYRDAALMAMVLRETGNLRLIRDWIMAIRDPFDRNNKGLPEADNPGQVLFLTSLVSDKTHPVVQAALDSVRQFRRENYITGKTDSDAHPVYQTRWLKFGLKSLGLPDPYTIPKQYDRYATLCWWDSQQEPVGDPAPSAQKADAVASQHFPYLDWAEDHYNSRAGNPERRGMVANLDYPLSWEQQASHAHYPGMMMLDKELFRKKLVLPHSRHAAEMFLLLITP
jgi:hypothetical protein